MRKSLKMHLHMCTIFWLIAVKWAHGNYFVLIFFLFSNVCNNFSRVKRFKIPNRLWWKNALSLQAGFLLNGSFEPNNRISRYCIFVVFLLSLFIDSKAEFRSIFLLLLLLFLLVFFFRVDVCPQFLLTYAMAI